MTEHPESMPDLKLDDLDARQLLLVLTPRAFDLADTAEDRFQLLGHLLALVEEDRLLENQNEANRRLSILQAHQIEAGLPLDEEEPVEDLLPDEDDDEDNQPVSVTFVQAIRDEDDEEGDVV